MTGIKQKFNSLNISNKFPLVNIVDGTQSPVLGCRVVHTTPLILTDVLFIPKFPISMLSISQFTKHNNSKITFFFLLIMCFMTCRLGGGLVRGMSKEVCVI